ncbi:Gp37-like protein [Leucobacter sp.]
MIQASEFTVYVRDRELERQGVLAGDDLADLSFEPVRDGVGQWSVTLPDQVHTAFGFVPHKRCEQLREPGSGIVIRRAGKTVFSGPMESRKYAITPDQPRGIWTISGVSDEVVLEDALAWPTPANPVPQAAETAVDVRDGNGAGVLLEYVRANIGEWAPASRRGGLAEKLVTLGADWSIGELVQESVRYENLLAVCQRIARQSGAHFRVVDEGGQLVLQTYLARDRTAETRWTVKHGFLDSLEWESGAPGVTRPLVGGSGVGEYRPMVAPTTIESEAAELEWGRKREVFVDSRGVDEIAELEQRGREVLEHPIAGLVADPSELTATGWGTAWDVGDVVTLPETGVTYPITSAPVKVSGGTVQVQAVLGALADDDTVQRSVEQRLSNLERNESGVPTGTIALFYGAVAPAGWLFCRGATVSADLYPSLVQVLGEAFGVVTLPDFRGRVPVGLSSVDAEFNAIGKTFGTKTHTLTIAESPSHNHGGSTGSNGGHSHGVGGLGRLMTTDRTTDFSPRLAPTTVATGTQAAVPAYGAQTTVGSESATSSVANHQHSISSQGGGGAHNNVQPSLTVNFIIKT